MTEAPVTPASVQVPADDSAPITLDFTGHALRVALISRNHITSLPKLAWDRPGIYVLIGGLSFGGKTEVYVGESTGLRKRLITHSNNPPFVWWRAVLIARDTTDGFNSAEVGYLEGRLAGELRAAKGLTVIEGKENIDTTLPDHQLFPLDALIPTILSALRITGLDTSVAEEQEEELDTDQEEQTQAVGKKHYGISLAQLAAAGYLNPGARVFFDQRGTKAEAVINANGEMILEDVAYETPSGAGSVVLGGKAVNGWVAWRLGEDGPTLDDLRKRLLDERAEGS